MKIVVLATILLAGLYSVAGAQSPGSSPTPTPTETAAPAAPPAPPRVYYLEVEPADLAALSQALMELPKKIADPLAMKLNMQLKMQDDLAAKAAKAKEPAPAPSPEPKKRK